MKVKLTPELAYLIGLWRKCKAFEGLGVHARQDVLETFSKEVITHGLATTDRMLTEENKVYFYHSAYRKFFQDIEKDQLERFKYLNEYAANYLAGLFDAVGEIDEKGILSFERMNRQDELMLLRLGFQSKRKKEKLVVERPLIFLAFIKNYVKIKNDDRAFQYLNKKAGKPTQGEG